MFDYRIPDIKAALEQIGIQAGDDIFIHSNIGFFGRMNECKKREILCKAFLDTILTVISESGTLVVPTFSYSFCHGEIFSPIETPTGCGLLSQYVIQQKNAVRSLDPNFSVASIGMRAVHYTKNPTNESFGKGSFFDRFIQNNGKIICMNFDAGSTFNGTIIDGNKKIRDYFVHFVYSLKRPEDAPDLTAVHSLCRSSGILKTANLGKGTMLAMESQTYCEVISEELKRRPRFMTKGK